jgi:hypothetical protein
MEKGLDVMKRVAVEGYLAPSEGSFTLCGSTCDLRLMTSPGTEAGAVRVNFKVGTGNNEIEELGKEYSQSDIRVRAKDGRAVGVGARVRVTASRLGTVAENSCQLTNVELVEAL